ncbi:MAG: CotH kinase family protein [Eubacterium sp.]|nr:CotH kinase family protein [Eubacterium sp.]
MKKSVKRIIAVISALAILAATLCAVPFVAYASGAPDAQSLESSLLNVWADPENVLTQEDVAAFKSGNKTTMAGAVGIHKRTSSGSNYYLFLPSNADCNNLKFWFPSGTTVKIDDTTLTSGEPTNALSAINAGGVSQGYTFTIGGTSYSVNAMKSGEVGAIYIDTSSGSISSINSNQSNYDHGTILVTKPDGTVDYDGELAKMNGRGNATWDVTGKKPYNIKLAESASLQGMPKAKKWCLIANDDGTDPSLLKDQIIYDFADYVGVPYQVHTKPVDLYVNQQYFGSYQLAEKVQIKSNRINITDAYENLELANGTVDPTTGLVTPKDLTGTSTTSVSESASGDVGAKKYSSSLTSPSDVTGGYVFELEISNRWYKENAGFSAYNGQGWTIKSCDYISTDMCNYCYDLLYALGGAVYNNGVVPNKSVTTSFRPLLTTISKTNPAPAAKYQGKKWTELLDAKSAVLFYWVQEYYQNLDASTTSNYFFKDSDSVDGMIYAGPIWDMDHAWYYNGSQSRWGYSCSNAQTWYVKNMAIYRWKPSDGLTTYSAGSKMCRTFFGALANNCTDFWPMVEKYWFTTIQPATQILLGNAVDESGKLRSVAEYAATIEKSGKMNSIRHSIDDYSASSVTSSLTQWLNKRNTWINGQISQKSITNAAVEPFDEYFCTGNEIKPVPVVTYNGIALEEGVDYELSYANNIAVGYDAEVILTGKGMFTGTASFPFTISKGTLSGGSVSIYDGAYSGDVLTAEVTNASGETVNNFITYQWYSDGTAISGATGPTYTVSDDDRGTALTVVAKGDGTNMSYAQITSNPCTVYDGVRPTGYSRSIAQWNYDYTAAPEALVNADASGTGYYYMATGGEKADTAELRASVNASTSAKIKWSGTADLYGGQIGTNETDQVPVMGTSKTDGLAWGQYPYFETSVSTKGYEDIKFSAYLGGTKKAPRSWLLQYSLDGVNFTSVENTEYIITDNKTMIKVFNEVQLPAECEDKTRVYIRMTVCEDAAINGINVIVNQTSGDAAVNNIEVTGVSKSVITSLDAPTVSTDSKLADTSTVFSSNSVSVKDNNGGADVYFSVDGSTPQLYTEAFNPFDSTNVSGDTKTVTAYAQFGEIVSDVTTLTLTYGGADINSFSYETYPQNETNATVFSTGGIYGESGKMTAYTDGVSQYVPLWNEKNGAFAISPDDGALWSADSGYTFDISTAGFENVKLTCKAYTTSSGPKSLSLQYSLDGSTWNTVISNSALPTELGDYMTLAALPGACDNQKQVLIRLVTTENQTNAGETLHNNLSKGNLYINDITISGDENGELKMPYTNKSTSYFGTGTIKYVSPDGEPMQYIVTDTNNNIIVSGSYPDTGISISTAAAFNSKSPGPYNVSVWAGDIEDSDRSEINTKQYYYKGETVTQFKYSDKKPFESYVSASGFSASNTGGTNAGTLSMCPNGVTTATLSYTETYGVKVSWAADNIFTATKNLDVPAGNGYWLIDTSSLGYTDLTLNLEQLSSNKGPRDWAVAYSTNGSSYTYVASSNARAISNDAADTTVETFNNLPLPSACDNQAHLYIKVFINGGETVEGDELDDPLEVTKGNTGINAIELSGVPMPSDYTLTVNTVMLEDPDVDSGSYAVDTAVTVNGEEYETENGTLTVTVSDGETVTIVANSGMTFERTLSFTADSVNAASVTIPVVAIDFNSDGVINAKDYAIILKEKSDDLQLYKTVFQNFMNVKENNFVYAH